MSQHFSIEELSFSQTAVRRGIANVPNEEQERNLAALCEHILEPARAALGPLRVTSGYRNAYVNALVGGSPQSQHMRGEAADLIPVNAPLRELYLWLFENAPFDQLIWEYGAWVHVSHKRGEPGRRELLAAYRVSALGTVYRQARTPEEAFAMVKAA